MIFKRDEADSSLFCYKSIIAAKARSINFTPLDIYLRNMKRIVCLCLLLFASHAFAGQRHPVLKLFKANDP